MPSSKVQPLPPVPERWGAGMTVQHRITGNIGEVCGVDFDEMLVTVQCGEYDLTWRVENVFEVAGLGRQEATR